MLNQKTLIVGVATLAGVVSASAATVNQENRGANLDSISGEVGIPTFPCVAKVPENCPKNPIPKNPIPKNIDNPEDPSLVNLDITEALQCIHFFDAQVTEGGIQKVNKEDVEFAENCLDGFVQGLLGN